MIKKDIRGLEEYFFFLVMVLNLIPVFAGKFFPTMDGPAHLYNSNIIKELIFNNNDTISNYFSLNAFPVPNWLGHFILSFFNLFFPAYLAEKVLLISYLIFLPLSYRALMNAIQSNHYYLSYIIFPLSYSFLFLLGFYNFSLGLVLLFTTLAFIIRNYANLNSKKDLLLLLFLFALTYFSHIFIFSLLLTFIATFLTSKLLIDILNTSDSIKEILKRYLTPFIIIAIAASIPLSLTLYYFYVTPFKVESGIFIPREELLNWLKNLRPIIAYNLEIEEAYTKKLSLITFSAFLISLYTKTNKLVYQKNLTALQNLKNSLKQVLNISDCWLLLAGFLLFLYFTLPDSDNNAGFVSVRLCLLFFMILFLWITSQEISSFFLIIFISGILFCHFQLNTYYLKVIRSLNHIAVECNRVAKFIAPNSVVLPINNSNNWLTGHFSNYLGVDKPIVILENYESDAGYFPVQWNNESIPNILLDTLNVRPPCYNWKTNQSNSQVKIDYVFVLGNLDSEMDSCKNLLKKIVQENYILKYNSDNCQLYESSLK